MENVGKLARNFFNQIVLKFNYNTMHIIDLLDFADYEPNDIYEYLLLQEETVFYIRWKRDFIAPEAERSDIEAEYFDALYFGEKLSEFSDDFVYFTPSEYSRAAFVYRLVTSDMLKLANTLYFLIRGIIVDESSFDCMIKYWVEKTLFGKNIVMMKLNLFARGFCKSWRNISMLNSLIKSCKGGTMDPLDAPLALL